MLIVQKVLLMYSCLSYRSFNKNNDCNASKNESLQALFSSGYVTCRCRGLLVSLTWTSVPRTRWVRQVYLTYL